MEIKNSLGVVLTTVEASNLAGANLYCANLQSAFLQSANLRNAFLQSANLRNANLSGANLYGANLSSANLYGANLYGANLYCANLSSANLRCANLSSADLAGANLAGANLSSANLRCANLSSAKSDDKTIWPHFQICPERGSFIAWKKTTKGVIKIRIPKEAKRTASLVGRKCRAEFVKVLGGPGVEGTSPTHGSMVYVKGEIVRADSFDPDPKVECTHGIHFFMTKAEALEYT